jgi:hypothetical protein
MRSPSLPSTSASEPAPPALGGVRTMTILRLDNEESLPELLGNPQRLRADIHDRDGATASAMDTMIRALAAENPKALARAKAILGRMKSASISVGWLTATARRNTPDLPIHDLRGDPDATEACLAHDQSMCPMLATAIDDPSVGGVFVDHPAFDRHDVWIALLKPNTIATLNADARLHLEMRHREFSYDELFGHRSAVIGHHLLTMTSALAKFLAALGGLVLIAHNIGLI